jgi:hypothetical protein
VQPVPQWPVSCDHQLGALAEPAHGLDEDVDALLGDEPAGKAHPEPIAHGPGLRFPVRKVVGRQAHIACRAPLPGEPSCNLRPGRHERGMPKDP